MARLAVNPYRPLLSVNGSFIWTHSEIFIAQQQLNKQTEFQLLFSSVLDPNHILTFLLAHESSLLCLLTPTKSRPKRQRVHVYVKTEHCNIQFFTNHLRPPRWSSVEAVKCAPTISTSLTQSLSVSFTSSWISGIIWPIELNVLCPVILLKVLKSESRVMCEPINHSGRSHRI